MALNSRKYIIKGQTSSMHTRLLTRRRANSAPNRATPAKRKKTSSSSAIAEETESEASLRFKIHKCLKKINDNRGALAALEKIRPPVEIRKF